MPSQFPFHGIFSSLGQDSELQQSQSPHPLQDAYDPFSESGMPPLMPPQQNQQHASLPSIGDGQGHGTSSAAGQMAVDVYEQDNYYIIRAPVAGVELGDLDIEVSDNVITIRGNRSSGDDIPSDQFYVQECFWGAFERKVTLPCTIDPKKVKATFNKKCILKILVPKEEKVKIVRINEG